MSITFKGVTSSSLGLKVKSLSPILAAKKRIEEEYVIGRDGAYTFEDGYDNKVLSFMLTLPSSTSLTTRETALRSVANWLQGSGELSIGYKDGLVFDAVVISDIKDKIYTTLNEITVSFSVKPIARGSSDVVASETGVVTGQDIVFSCSGLYKSFPVIKLTGTASSVTVSDGTRSFTYTGLSSESVYVDCDNMVVHDGASSPVNKIAGFDGDFLEIVNGSNTFTVTGTITTLDVEIRYRDRYLS